MFPLRFHVMKCHRRYPEMSSGDTHRKRQTYVEAQKERKSDEHAAACGSEQNGSHFEAFLRKQRFKHTCVVSRSLCCKTELSGTMCKDFFSLCEACVHNVQSTVSSEKAEIANCYVIVCVMRCRWLFFLILRHMLWRM